VKRAGDTPRDPLSNAAPLRSGSRRLPVGELGQRSPRWSAKLGDRQGSPGPPRLQYLDGLVGTASRRLAGNVSSSSSAVPPEAINPLHGRRRTTLDRRRPPSPGRRPRVGSLLPLSLFSFMWISSSAAPASHRCFWVGSPTWAPATTTAPGSRPGVAKSCQGAATFVYARVTLLFSSNGEYRLPPHASGTGCNAIGYGVHFTTEVRPQFLAAAVYRCSTRAGASAPRPSRRPRAT